MKQKNQKYPQETTTYTVVSEPAIAYGMKRESIVCQEHSSRNDILRAIDTEELLSRLRPRIKSLFE